MLTSLTLQNYRGFRDHTVPLQEVTVIVGRNNAGKSTLVEALRLIAITTERIRGLRFRNPPSWTGLPLRSQGVAPQLDNLGIDFSTVFHQYGEAPATIEAAFDSGEKVKFFVNAGGDGHALLWSADGVPLRTYSQSISFPRLHILPQLSPLLRDEQVLSDDYVRRNLYSTLSSRHFRNQLRTLHGPYRAFRRLAEDTWPGLQIRELQGMMGERGQNLHLHVRDRAFVAEVARMGHGLQMWLQVMWFLVRTPEGASVVLDEPDLYMHPDLQRRMIRIVRDRFPQVLMATHSVEIMAEVAPSEILIIDRNQSTSRFADSDPVVQALIEHLGGVHNIHLARLATASRCLLVEGKDNHFLKLVHDLLLDGGVFNDGDDEENLYSDGWSGMPNLPIGGWGGWQYAVGSALYIRNSVSGQVKIYCVLDSDFHTEDEIGRRLNEAKAKKVNLHIWRRKEIENYFLVPSAIARLIAQKGRRTKAGSVTADDVLASSRPETRFSALQEGEIAGSLRVFRGCFRR